MSLTRESLFPSIRLQKQQNPTKNPMKIFTINSNKTKITSLAAAVALLGLGAIQAQGQSFNFNFADAGPDGWYNSGFGSSPAATVVNIAGLNYLESVLKMGIDRKSSQTADLDSDHGDINPGFGAG